MRKTELANTLFAATLEREASAQQFGLYDTINAHEATSRRAPEHEYNLSRGHLVERYVILHLIGRGGMGSVYAAYDPELDRKIALKLLHLDVVAETRNYSLVLREAKALAQVPHPNIVAIYDTGIADGRLWIAMEYVNGPTLSVWMNPNRTIDSVVSVFSSAGAGLAAAHDNGIIHRDFKPDNIMIGIDGRVRVTDFGLASRTKFLRQEDDKVSERPLGPADITSDGQIVGTPLFMAPEQWQSPAVTAKADQFSFCASMWWALYGEPPFQGDTLAQLCTAICRGTLPPPRSRDRVPKWLYEVLSRGLRPDPSQRWSSMSELLHELTLRPTRARRRTYFALIAMTLVTVSLATRYLQHRQSRLRELHDLVVRLEEKTAAAGQQVRNIVALGAREPRIKAILGTQDIADGTIADVLEDLVVAAQVGGASICRLGSSAAIVAGTLATPGWCNLESPQISGAAIYDQIPLLYSCTGVSFGDATIGTLCYSIPIRDILNSAAESGRTIGLRISGYDYVLTPSGFELVGAADIEGTSWSCLSQTGDPLEFGLNSLTWLVWEDC